MIPRLLRYIAWRKDPYRVVVSSPEQARINLKAMQEGRVIVDPEDLEIWSAVYGHEKPEDYPQRYSAEVARDPRFVQLHPINFWGRAIDRNGLPVDGAEFIFVWLNFRGGRQGWESIKTAADGSARLLNAAGPSLVVHVRKQGYVESPGAGGSGFEYVNPTADRFIPDPLQPVEFILGKPRFEPLLRHIHKIVILPKTGEVLGYDFAMTRYTTNGPFFFRYVVGPRDAVGRAEVRLEIRAQRGGFLETSDVLPWDAPKAGYAPQLESAWAKGFDWANREPAVKAYFHLTEPDRWGLLSAVLQGAGPRDDTHPRLDAHFVITTNSSRWLDHRHDADNVVYDGDSVHPEDGILP